MEWITGGGSNEVDIGYVPLMRVFSQTPSILWQSEDNDTALEDSGIVWDHEISTSEAKGMVEQTMYPFKKVCVCQILVTLVHFRSGSSESS
jgi:hypothetical protein